MDFLKGDIKVPGTQGKVPKWAAVAGLGVVGVLIWRARTKKAATPAAAGADQYPPDGTTGDPSDPYSTDPATGTTYGDEATAGNIAATGGIGVAGAAGDAFPWDGTYNNPNDPYSMDSSSGTTFGNEGTLIGGGGGGGATGQAGPPFSTNAQWSQYVLGYFTQNSYDNIPGRTDAIGRYLDGLPVDSQQETWINDATAIGGRPPVSGTGGFPPSIRVSGTKTGGKTYAGNPVKGLTATGAGKTDVTLKWDASPHATVYEIKITSGRTTVRTQTATADSSHVGGLKAGATYEASVTANPARPSARPATVTFKTSAGPAGGAKVTVPDVVGMSYQQASAVLTQSGLHARRATANIGTVTGQMPAARTAVPRGSTIMLEGQRR